MLRRADARVKPWWPSLRHALLPPDPRIPGVGQSQLALTVALVVGLRAIKVTGLADEAPSIRLALVGVERRDRLDNATSRATGHTFTTHATFAGLLGGNRRGKSSRARSSFPEKFTIRPPAPYPPVRLGRHGVLSLSPGRANPRRGCTQSPSASRSTWNGKSWQPPPIAGAVGFQ